MCNCPDEVSDDLVCTRSESYTLNLKLDLKRHCVSPHSYLVPYWALGFSRQPAVNQSHEPPGIAAFFLLPNPSTCCLAKPTTKVWVHGEGFAVLFVSQILPKPRTAQPSVTLCSLLPEVINQFHAFYYRILGPDPYHSALTDHYTHRPHRSSFLGFIFRILSGNPKKQLLCGLWVVSSMVEFAAGRSVGMGC